MDRRSASRCHDGASHSDQPADRRPPKVAKLCRPSETVLDILPNSDIGRFVKEDGEAVAPRN